MIGDQLHSNNWAAILDPGGVGGGGGPGAAWNNVNAWIRCVDGRWPHGERSVSGLVECEIIRVG